MKKNIILVLCFATLFVCMVTLLVCMVAVFFGCAEPEGADVHQSDGTDIDISGTDAATQKNDSQDVDITVADDGTKRGQPVVTVQVELPPCYYTTQQDREKFCGMDMCVRIDSKSVKFVACVLLVTYDPNVLECGDSICPVTEDAKLLRQVTMLEPGKILITVSAFGSYYTDPICFHVLSNEEIDFDVSLVSYIDESGIRRNAQLVVDMPVKVPQIKDLSINK